MCRGLARQRKPTPFDVLVDLFKESLVSSVAFLQASGKIGHSSDRSVPYAFDVTKQNDALGRKLREIDCGPAIGSGNQRERFARPSTLSRRFVHPECAQPPSQIMAAIAAWHTAMAPDGQVYRPPCTDQLFADLRA